MCRLPLFLTLAFACTASAETVTLKGLHQPVEILRDRWGVPHIYAQSTEDLFFAQGYITARDRLWQLDTWRRTNSGRFAEVLGPRFIERDRLARLLRYQGDWDREWSSYAPDAKQIAASFAQGINAYIAALAGKRPPEFAQAGYDPGTWEPEDVAGRVAVLSVVGNAARELRRAMAAKPGEPDLPAGISPSSFPPRLAVILNELSQAVEFEGAKGSNNWVVDGTMTASGKPLLANDPHRVIAIPSLRKTVHLVAPGWNIIGAGEPALPGIALGHNESVAFGFTIVGIDQQDLYVEKLHPANRSLVRVRDAWAPVRTIREQLPVKGEPAGVPIELRYTTHGPILYEEDKTHRAFALRWVGAEPGGAGYLAGLSLARAKNWPEFTEAVKRFKTPSENLVYADVNGNIGWYAVGQTPLRHGWNGAYPVPGDSGEYEWADFLPAADLPHSYNPASHFIATANHNILPPGYTHFLTTEWGAPYRVDRISELLRGRRGLTVLDFQNMQNDVTSVVAKRFVAAVRKWKSEGKHALLADAVRRWDGTLSVDSMPAAIYEVWFSRILAASTGIDDALLQIERNPAEQLQRTLEEAAEFLVKQLGPDAARWRWGALHQIEFRHDLHTAAWNRGPIPRPGDGTTVNATSGTADGRFPQLSGASYREIFDLSDWDRSVTINSPGESGDPASPHYSDLLPLWSEGRYHPLPYTRKAVEAATEERINLEPPH